MPMRGGVRLLGSGFALSGPGDRTAPWEFLGATKLAAAAATTGALTIPARDNLLLSVRIIGYASGGDIGSLRFNGDSGLNYWSRYLSAAASGVTIANNQNVSQAMARLFALVTNSARSGLVHIINLASATKVGNVTAQTSTGAAATAGTTEWGGFEWVNTTAQITSIELRTAAGVNFLAGTGFAVWGANLD